MLPQSPIGRLSLLRSALCSLLAAPTLISADATPPPPTDDTTEDSLVARIAAPLLHADLLSDFHINPSFLGLDPEQDAGLQKRESTVLPNNVPQRLTLAASATVALMFEVTATTTATATSSATTTATSTAAAKRDVVDDPELKALEEEEDDEYWGQELPHKQKRDSKKVYITANTCVQPSAENSNVTSTPPQLTLYVSTSSSNTSPGPDNTNGTETVPFTQGAVMYELSSDTEVYFSIASGNLTNHTGSWTVEVAASTDEYYHSYVATEQRLFWVDSDAAAAILMTGNLTSDSQDTELIGQILNSTPPYAFYAAKTEDSALDGVRYSYCGLQNYASVASIKNGEDTNTVNITMTTRSGGLPKEQFYIQGLSSKTSYEAIPVLVSEIVGNDTQEFTEVEASSRRRAVSNATAGGGGVVYAATAFTTKEGTTCRIITSLSFCNDTEYAVPSNENTFPNIVDLANFYDDYAAKKYAIFEKALAQTACDASPAGMYSLARNCDDCGKAYKQWLCSVVIPRCEDYDNAASDGHVRNANTTFPNGTMLPGDVIEELSQHTHAPAYLYSRNADINDQVQPGPYREILPCDDLCYDIVQSCPAALGFDCPLRGTQQYDSSYAQKNSSKTLACNFPGALHQASGVGRLGVGIGSVFTIVGMMFVSYIVV